MNTETQKGQQFKELSQGAQHHKRREKASGVGIQEEADTDQPTGEQWNGKSKGEPTSAALVPLQLPNGTEC
jgi:hypothetical protein